MTLQEIWKPYIYHYEISNTGKLRNAKTGTILKTRKIGHGYLATCVSLGDKTHYKMIRIHRAVAETFIPNPNNLPQVNHIDGNKLNNMVDNLEWCDNRYNSQHAWDHNLCTRRIGETNPSAKLTWKDIEFIREHYKARDKQFGVRALSRKYGVHHETIRHVLLKENWK